MSTAAHSFLPGAFARRYINPAAPAFSTFFAVVLLLSSLLFESPARADTAAPPPTIAYKVVAQYPHDAEVFTQGLEIAGDALFESSGLYGKSFIARGPLPGIDNAGTNTGTPKVERQSLPKGYFGEGLTVLGDRIFVATWREQRGLIFGRDLKPLGEFPLQGEGWGLTHDKTHLILSNGSPTLQFIDPNSFVVKKRIVVQSNGTPVDRLNELEWIEGRHGRPARLLANIWQTDELVVIDPADGRVTARLDLSQLYPVGLRSPRADVLNGIAFDARDQTLLVTGKLWPRLYRLQLLQPLP